MFNRINYLDHALSEFSGFSSGNAFKNHFALLLEQDGEIANDAWWHAYEAHEQVALHLLTTAAQRAAELWADSDTQSATLSFVSSIVNAPFDNDLIDKAIKTLGPLGDAESARLAEAWHELEVWTPDSSETLQTSENLRQLADIIDDRLASAPVWRKTCDNHTKRVGWAMRNYAVDRANDHDDYKEAARVTQILRENKILLSDPEFAARLETDWDALSNLIADAALADAEAQRATEQRAEAEKRKAAERKAKLEAQSNKSSSSGVKVPYPLPTKQTPSRTATRMNSFISGFWIIFVIGILALAFSPRPNGTLPTSSQTEPTPSEVAVPSNPVVAQPEITTAPEDSNVTSSRTARLQTEWDTLKTANVSAVVQLGSDEQDLKNKEEFIDQQKKAVDRDRATVDRFDHEAVFRFNKKVNNLNEKVDDYKASQNEYNQKVRQYNDRLKRLKEIRTALEETGN